MPKMKTRKCAVKRMKLSKTGKVHGDRRRLRRRAEGEAEHNRRERPCFHHRSDQSALARTFPSLMRFSITSWAMFFGTASYCLKIIVNVPRPCVTVRIAFE